MSADEVALSLEKDARLQHGMSVRDIILLDPRVRLLMVVEAIRAMGSVLQCWSSKTQSYEEKIDYSTRLKAVAWIASYSDGLPVQTNLNVNATPGANKGLDPDEMLAASPSALEAMERTLSRAKKLASKRVEKVVESQ